MQQRGRDIFFLRIFIKDLCAGKKVRLKVGKGICDPDAPLAVRSSQVGGDLSGLLGFQSLSIIEKRF